MPLTPGSKLGAYEILAFIGRGGMGAVYRARDPRLGRDVAIKVLPDEMAGDPDRLSRFQREARVVAALNHPHIVTIFSVEEAEGTHFLTMELIEGQTLARLIPAGGLPADRFVAIAADLADALADAHEKGIVHRDLKPANVMVTNDGRVKVLDFGLAREVRGTEPEDEAHTALTEPGVRAVIGTPGYMSPEQVSGRPIDHRSDIFSLGIVLHQMASGRNPFAGASSAEQISSILRDSPPSLSQTRPELPSDFSRIVRRCLEKDPRRRIQTARDVANEFHEMAGHRSAKVPVSGSSWPSAAESHTQLDSAASGEATQAKTKQGRFEKWWAYPAVAFAAIMGAGFWYLNRPLPPPRITAYTQITHDGHGKILGGADGSRLYFMLLAPRSIAQVSIAGGEIAPVPMAVPGDFANLYDVSPDGSSALIRTVEKGNSVSTTWNVRILGGSFRQLGRGMARPAFSPDGKLVAYFTREGEFWVVQSDGTGAHKIASPGSIGCCIRWSPDGETIRFTRDSRIWEMSSTGSNLHQLLTGWHSPGSACCGSWTPDGRFYIFMTTGSRSETDKLWALDERHSLFRQPAAEPVQLTTGPINWVSPFPSQDGTKIFSDGFTQRGELFRLDPQAKQFQPLLGGISAEGVSFSRDGQSVAYVSYPEGILWKANRDGSNPVQLTDSPIYPLLPRWSPDGSQIVFNDLGSSYAAIYEVSRQGGSPRRLLPGDKRTESHPTWSADGKRIAFASGEFGGGDEKSEISILDLASQQVTSLPGSVGLFSPRWSPDGRFIAALLFDSTGMKIFDVATQRWTELPEKQGMEFPEWSRDSTSIYFLRSTVGRDRGIFRIRVMGGKAERIHDMTDWHLAGVLNSTWMGLDPTDAPLLLRDIGSDDLYALTLEEK